MIQKLLVGLDGSRAVTELAIEWAKQFEGELTGVTIVDDVPNREPGLYSSYSSFKVLAYMERLARMKQETRRYAEEFETRCRAVSVRFSTCLQTGDPVEILLALHEDYDLTLLPKEPRFRFGTQDESDDTLIAVLRKARRPVVAVPATLPQGESVVVAYDGGSAAVDALQSFAESGLGVGAPVSVVAVAEDRETAAPRAVEAANYLAAHNIRAEPHPIVSTSGHEAEALHTVAEHENARMVVMGEFSHGRIREWFNRSTTTRLLRDEPRLLYLHHHPE